MNKANDLSGEGRPSSSWPVLHLVRLGKAFVGGAVTVFIVWYLFLEPLGWPPLPLVAQYFAASAVTPEPYVDMAMTAARILGGFVIGFLMAVVCAALTGRTTWGWILLFLPLLVLQKIPAVAMVHVYVKSKLGIGTPMTVALTATVVFTFTWLVLHHRVATLDRREVFALRVTGLTGWRLGIYGMMPHLGSAVGASARLAIAIATVITIIGEWQGLWDVGSVWSNGLGVRISRAYEAIDSTARVLTGCLWLGLLGAILDGFVQGMLRAARVVFGVNLSR